MRAVAAAIGANSEALSRQAVPAASLLGVAIGRTPPTGPPPLPPPPAADPDVPPPHPPPAEERVVDEGRFEVRLRCRRCPLGNTYAFRLVQRLSQSPGVYVPMATLGEDVWADAEVSRNAVQRTASALRKRLRDHSIEEVEIDGSQREHYRLVLPGG